ncbi:unnamed protein product [Moneuplotes crassus]|uniref:TPR-like protein n=1 Tax=Euplotes crassus TaxID=5936 RepID=A0AAD1URU1_EUPCR|nr:unnamed protein product [Moneuplotes crassus]
MNSLEVSKASSQAKLKVNPEVARKSNTLLEKGKEFLNLKNYDDALKFLTKALKVNEHNYDAMFFKGVTYLDSGNPSKAIKELTMIIENVPNFKNTVYLVLSTCYMRNNDTVSALMILNKAIQKYPKFVEAYVARGQVYTLLNINDNNNLSLGQIYERIITDYQSVINLLPNKGLGYIGKGDALKGLGDYSAALKCYSKAIQLDEREIAKGTDINKIDAKDSLINGRFKRARLYYQLKMFEQAQRDLNELLKTNPENAKAHFYLGKILSKQDPHQEAFIHFEQVITHNDDSFLSCNALLEIAKLRIKEKDFYEAHYSLKRIGLFNFKSQKLTQYQTFTEGVLYLIKRKIKKGIQLLSSLEVTSNTRTSSSATTLKPKMREPTIASSSTINCENSEKDGLDSFLKPLVYIYRAYGYISIESYEKAIADLISGAKLTKLDLCSQYNKLLATGFSKLNKSAFTDAQSIFKKASFGDFSKNKEPYLLQLISMIKSVSSSEASIDVINVDLPKKRKAIESCIEVANEAITKNPDDLSLYYHRGLLLFYLHQFFDAFLDFDYIVEKEEEPNSKYYLARGKCYACLSMFPEAVKDLTAAITLDEECLDAYLNRGKCAYLLGDTPLSFLDFQKLIMVEPKNPLVHVYAGNLLMTTGSYDDAAKAFSNADQVKKCALAIYQRARCNIALSNIGDAMNDLATVIELNPHDKIAFTDKECLYAVTSAMKVLKQSLDVEEQKLEVAKLCNILTKLTNKDYNNNDVKSKNMSTRTHAQIIPNVRRIKVEKLRIVDYMKKKEKDKYIADVKDVKVEHTRDYTEPSSRHKTLAESITPFSYYKENIFSEEDFFLYRAILLFYSGQYDRARKDFEVSLHKKEANKDDNDNSDTESETSNQTDLSDVGLCSLNVHESKYNQALCHLMLKEYREALEIFDELISKGPDKYVKSLYLIRGLIYQQNGEGNKSKFDFNKAFDEDQETAIKYFDDNKHVTIHPFPVSNRLCSNFPNVKLTIDKNHPAILTKPSFSFPFIKPPNMIPNVDERVLTKEFDISEFSLNKPEAPWINRCEYGIQFTDQIQYDEFKIEESIQLKNEKESTKSDKDEYSSRLPISVSEKIRKPFDFFEEDSDSN